MCGVEEMSDADFVAGLILELLETYKVPFEDVLLCMLRRRGDQRDLAVSGSMHPLASAAQYHQEKLSNMKREE